MIQKPQRQAPGENHSCKMLETEEYTHKRLKGAKKDFFTTLTVSAIAHLLCACDPYLSIILSCTLVDDNGLEFLKKILER